MLFLLTENQIASDDDDDDIQYGIQNNGPHRYVTDCFHSKGSATMELQCKLYEN